jgi:hypothetical protein
LVVTITVILAALAVLAAIVVVAVGGGGELSAEHPDHPPLSMPARRPVGGTDAALLRLPLGLWGYHKQITDEALHRFAQELTERDTHIAVLEQELAEARQRLGEDPRRSGPRALTAPATRTDGFSAQPALGTLADVPAAESSGYAARPDTSAGETLGYLTRADTPMAADDASADDDVSDKASADRRRPANEGEGQ